LLLKRHDRVGILDLPLKRQLCGRDHGVVYKKDKIVPTFHPPR
jgi:hypothetical protein